jgi:hypothetical protein
MGTCSAWVDEDDQEVAEDLQEADSDSGDEEEKDWEGAQGEVLARVEVGVSTQVEVRGPVKSRGAGQHLRDCQEGMVVCKSQEAVDSGVGSDLEDEPERPTLQCGASKADWVVFLRDWEEYKRYYIHDTDQDTVDYP